MQRWISQLVERCRIMAIGQKECIPVNPGKAFHFSITLFTLATASVLAACTYDASESISQRATPDNLALDPSIKRALQTIAATPDANAAGIAAVQRKNGPAMRSLLRAYGADPAYLASTAVELIGPRETLPLDPGALVLGAGANPATPGAPVQGLIYIGGLGWVDWWKLDFIGWVY